MSITKFIGYSTLAWLVFLTACVEPHTEYSKIPPGIWRGVLYLDPNIGQVSTGKDDISVKVDNSDELPFNFEIVYDAQDNLHMIIHNGDERIEVKDVVFGRDKATAKDTLLFNFKDYDTYIKAIYEERVMEGFWHINYKQGQPIKFKATYGDTVRFKKHLNSVPMDISGRWSIMFEPDTDGSYPGIGIFDQRGQELTGTFMTETGDYRYLQGMVSGKKMFLSCFDGAHAFLFEAKDLGDGKLNGIFRSGSTYSAPWIGHKDDNATLPSPWDMTKATNPDQAMGIQFKNHEGKLVDITKDDTYQDQAMIIEIMGTWCPNCKDANEFLKDWYKENPNTGIKILSLAFERYTDEAMNLTQIKKYRTVTSTPWDILLGGSYKKDEASKALPQIDRIISYPTLLFLDKDHKIKHIHTGFSGPATPEFANFKTKFDEIIKEIQ